MRTFPQPGSSFKYGHVKIDCPFIYFFFKQIEVVKFPQDFLLSSDFEQLRLPQKTLKMLLGLDEAK